MRPPMTRPIPDDPGAAQIASMFDINAELWYLVQAGDIQTGAVETMRYNGSQWQRTIAVELPVRRNHKRQPETLRFMIDPMSALALAESLTHNGRTVWTTTMKGMIDAEIWERDGKRYALIPLVEKK